jgi:hypothetical protein
MHGCCAHRIDLHHLTAHWHVHIIGGLHRLNRTIRLPDRIERQEQKYAHKR